jgi:hypothetical protein
MPKLIYMDTKKCKVKSQIWFLAPHSWYATSVDALELLVGAGAGHVARMRFRRSDLAIGARVGVAVVDVIYGNKPSLVGTVLGLEVDGKP